MRNFTSDQVILLERVYALSQKRSLKVCLVGGMLRDIFLGIDSLDFDFVVEGNGIEFAREFASTYSSECKAFEPFLTAKVSQLKDCPSLEELDFASARMETYDSPGSLPRVQPATLSQDFNRRDFTINALAIEIGTLLNLIKNNRSDQLFSHLIDPLGGLEDLKNKLIRSLHQRSFLDDPTRIFRAARYAQRIGGTIEPKTLELIKQALTQGALQSISETRKLNEIRKAFHAQDALAFIKEISKLEVLPAWSLIPEGELMQFCLNFERELNIGCAPESQALPEEYPLEVFLRLVILHTKAELRETRIRSFGLPRKVSSAIKQWVASQESQSGA